jgi:hypothetical protein
MTVPATVTRVALSPLWGEGRPRSGLGEGLWIIGRTVEKPLPQPSCGRHPPPHKGEGSANRRCMRLAQRAG